MHNSASPATAHQPPATNKCLAANPHHFSPPSFIIAVIVIKPYPATNNTTTMKIPDRIAALSPHSPFVSLEFFPPKTASGFANLAARLERMAAALDPLFVTVTWGAGGSTASKSLDLASLCQRQLGLTTCLHLTCTNMSRQLVDDALDAAVNLGIDNILALRGDPPCSEYAQPGECDAPFAHAADLVSYIRARHGAHFAIGVAAYPDGHADESHPAVQDPRRDLPYLVDKVRAGADFIITQLTYDAAAYGHFEALLRQEPYLQHIPIIPGLLPVQTYQTFSRVTKLAHVRVPDVFHAAVDAVKTDDGAVKARGVDLLVDLVRTIRSLPSPTPRGFHFYTLNLEKSVIQVAERAHLISPHPSFANKLILDHPDAAAAAPFETPSAGAGMSTPAPAPDPATREATWDDFPNGRWGDARSPAFGDSDGYAPSSLPVSPADARRLWGFPVDNSDLSALFHRHLNGQLSVLPWSEGVVDASTTATDALSPETALIRHHLLALVDGRGWLTLASQPATNGLRSDDPVFGWGPPRDGFVFQKPFVEFFCPDHDFARLEPALRAQGTNEFTWLAANATGNFRSSADPPAQAGSDSSRTQSPSIGKNTSAASNSNAVTWGVFRGKEIQTPTMIEPVAFRAWAEEAFRIWNHWRAIFPPHSSSHSLLGRLHNDLWLVCVVGQRFGAGLPVGVEGQERERLEREEQERLWEFLAKA